MGKIGQVIRTVFFTGVAVSVTGSLSKLHDSSDAGPTPASVKQPEQKNTTEKKKKPAEGPWIASCEYWAPARSVPPTGRQSGSSASGPSEPKESSSASDVQSGSEDDEQQCGSDENKRWGLPQLGYAVNLRTLIAIVPDPIHANMALQFDRMIDALMGAAGEYQYVSSYYWLPWKNQTVPTEHSGELAVEQEHNASKSEHEPGLIIFRCVPPLASSDKQPPCEGDKKPSSHMLYLFLVGETPTTGIDGLQIQRAFQYQDQLLGSNGSGFRSFSDDQKTMAIIGPTFSGSAISLHLAIKSRLEKQDGVTSVFVNGATSTPLAANELDNPDIIYFHSFSYDSTYSSGRLMDLFNQSSSTVNRTRVAVLVEDGTTFGSASVERPPPKKAKSNASANQTSKEATGNAPANQTSKEATGNAPANQTSKEATGNAPENQTSNEVTPLTIRFPREISLLRNAQAENRKSESSSAEGPAPSPYLTLSLKDSNSYDSVPHLSRENTPLSQEAQLMAIARQLQHYGSEYIVISATSMLDQLFLAQFLHRACPDARLVFYSGDLLFEREIDNVPFIGTITLTPYPLFAPAYTPGSIAGRAYPDSTSQAYFNAASYTMNADPGEIPLAGYRVRSDNNQDPSDKNQDPSDKNQDPSDKNQDPSDKNQDPSDKNQDPCGNNQKCRPPLWVTAIGNDGYYPVGIAGDHGNRPEEDRILPKISSSRTLARISIGPTRLWYFLCLLVLLLCLSHSLILFVADFWSPFIRELAVSQSDRPRRRSMFIHIGTAMLFCMAFVVAVPLLPTFVILHLVQDFIGAVILSISTLLAGIVAVATTVSKTRKYLVLEKNRDDLLHEQNFHFIFNVIAWATALVVPSLWIYLCCLNHGWGLNSDASHVGLFFGFRCLHPGSGVSPVIPVLLLLFSWYLWAVCQAWRLRFSCNSRPMLPKTLPGDTNPPLFVSDDDLAKCAHSQSPCLVSNITCLFITAEIVHRFVKALRKPNGSTDVPVAQSGPADAPFAQSGPADVPVVQNGPADAPFAQSGPADVPVVQNGPADAPFAQSGPADAPPAQNGPADVPCGQKGLDDEHRSSVGITVILVYLVIFFLFVILIPVKGLDAFFWAWGGFPNPFELLIKALFFPLLVIALASWLRIILVWGSLKRGLLDRLDSLPIRFAFNRIRSEGRMAMTRQNSLRERWRDMARSVESMRQITNDNCLSKAGSNLADDDRDKLRGELKDKKKKVDEKIVLLLKSIQKARLSRDELTDPEKITDSECESDLDECNEDLPAKADERRYLAIMHSIEKDFGDFGQILLRDVLIPHWNAKGCSFVESEDSTSSADDKKAAPDSGNSTPSFIAVVEEFLVLRYIALIRAVLANIRYLMVFISITFVLAIVAWNSYPFEPRQFVDWIFTGLLIALGLGVTRVLAQIHRDAILSRIAKTTANELGVEFYVRIISFGALPLLTWLAYQFPGVGSTILKFLQPGIEVMK
jgi:hypothetical protein